MGCFKCNAINVRLFEVISEEGIVHVCKECFDKEPLPMIKKKEIDVNSIMNQRIYQRQFIKEPKRREQDKGLKHIAGRKYSEKDFCKADAQDLVDHFYWRIMRERRAQKMSREQLAEKIRESVFVVQKIEEGVLPKNYNSIIRKIEIVLGIKLFKDDKKPETKKGFDLFDVQDVTIADLRAMQRERELKKENKREFF